MAEWKWIFRCPVEGCGFVSRSYPGLKKHYRCNHAGDVCPVCGRRMRRVAVHLGLRASKDPAHRTYHALTVSHRNMTGMKTNPAASEALKEAGLRPERAEARREFDKRREKLARRMEA